MSHTPEYRSTLLSYLLGSNDLVGWVIGHHWDAYRGKPVATEATRALEDGKPTVRTLRPGLVAILQKVKPEGALATARAETEELLGQLDLPRDARVALNAVRMAIREHESAVRLEKLKRQEASEEPGTRAWENIATDNRTPETPPWEKPWGELWQETDETDEPEGEGPLVG